MSPEIKEKIIMAAADLSLEHDMLIIPLVWSEEKKEKNRTLNTLLYHNVMDEGVRV